jgi:hypothetical protein
MEGGKMKSKEEKVDWMLEQLKERIRNRTDPSPPKSASDSKEDDHAELPGSGDAGVHPGPGNVPVPAPSRTAAEREAEERLELEKRLERLGIRLDPAYEHTFGCLACKDTAYQLREDPDKRGVIVSKVCDECTKGATILEARARKAEERKNKRKLRNTRRAMTQAASEPEEGVDSSWPPKRPTQDGIPF